MEKNCSKVVFSFVFAAIMFSALSSLGAPQTNAVPWTENFESYTNLTPLVDGTNGWYSYSSDAMVSTNCAYTGTKSAMALVGVTMATRFGDRSGKNVRLDMYVRPQVYSSTNSPTLSTNAAAQFFIGSNGSFVVGNGASWVTNSGGQSLAAIAGTTNFVKIRVHLRYKTRTWDLQAWTNGVLVASTNQMSFTSNLNYFTGFDVYNGGTYTSYVDDVTVRRWPSVKVNDVSLDNIRYIDGATPGGSIDGISE